MFSLSIGALGIGTGYDGAIAAASAAYGVPVPLIKAVIAVESAWDPTAFNPRDPSYGLMQINVKAHPDVSPAQALDPYFAIDYGTRYLSQQLARYGGDQGRALSAYNAGSYSIFNQAYVAEALTYQAYYQQNDPASGGFGVGVEPVDAGSGTFRRPLDGV